jgi:hypothetical protein
MIWYIKSAFTILPDAFEDRDRICTQIDQLKAKILRKRVRRIGRVSLMSSIGAVACLDAAGIAVPDGSELGIFHGTSLGNLSETNRVFQESISLNGAFPSPINFANSLCNITAFHIAQMTGANGPNILVVQEEFSFEGALRALFLSAQDPSLRWALAGATDQFVPPRGEHALRVNLDPELMFGEGSGWVCLSRTEEDCIGELLDVSEFVMGSNWSDSLSDRIQMYRSDGEQVVILPGLRITPEDLAEAKEKVPECTIRPYLDRTGHYPTASASGVALMLLERTTPALVVHLAKNAAGRMALILFRV